MTLNEPAEAVIGLVVGGVLLLVMASALEPLTMINLTLWGVVYLVVAVLLAVLVVVATLASIFK